MDQRLLEVLRELDAQRLDRRAFLKGLAGMAASAGVVLVSQGCAPAATPIPAATPTPAAPKIGGHLDVCVWEGYDDAAVAKPFTDEYGVTVGGTYIGSNEECFTKEKAAPGTFDAIGINLTYCESLYNAGLLLPVDLEIVTTWPDIIDTLQEQPYISYEGKPWLVPYIWGATCVNYNPEFVELPDTFEFKDIAFDDRWAGKMCITDDPAGMLILIGIMNGFEEPVTRITREQLRQNVELGIQLKERLVAIAPTFSDVTDMLVRGDAWLNLCGWEAVNKWAADAGATILSKHPVHSWSWSDGWMVTKNSDNVETAWAYVNQMTGPEAMATLTANMYCAPSNTKAFALLKGEVAEMFPREELEAALVNSPICPLPPDESEEYATMGEWQAAWEEIKAA